MRCKSYFIFINTLIPEGKSYTFKPIPVNSADMNNDFPISGNYNSQ